MVFDGVSRADRRGARRTGVNPVPALKVMVYLDNLPMLVLLGAVCNGVTSVPPQAEF